MRYLLLAAVAVLASLASAAPIAVTEPPDRPGSGGDTFTVDIGMNTVTGFVNGTPGCCDYQDNFSIFVPANRLVTSTFVTITDFTNLGGAAGLGCFTGAGCFGTAGFFGMSDPASGATVSYTATSPWASDGAGGANIGSFTYTLTLQVAPSTAPMPEPGTFALMIPALAGLWMVRRRR